MRGHLQVFPLCALGCTAVALYGYFITVWLSNGLMKVQCPFKTDTGLLCARWVLHTEDIGRIVGNKEITPWEVECVGMNAWKREGVESTYIIPSPTPPPEWWPTCAERLDLCRASPQDSTGASGIHGGRLWLNVGKTPCQGELSNNRTGCLGRWWERASSLSLEMF